MSINVRMEMHNKMINADEQFRGDIEIICTKHKDFFNDMFENGYSIVDVCNVAFEIFLYEYIWKYEQDVAVESGLLLVAREFYDALKWEHDDVNEVDDFYENVTKRILLYIRKFKLPIYDSNYAGKDLFAEVMALEDTNEYKLKLWYALLYPLYEGEDLDDFEKQQMINDVLVYYDFEYKIPQERQYLSEENYRKTKHIPKFDNVKVGDTWEGKWREAKFIRSLCLIPHNAGSNQRLSQVKSIKRSCRWEDDGKKITLLEIYPERLDDEKQTRTGKYENQFKNVLLYHLNNNEGIFVTSARKCFINTYAISQNYKKKRLVEYIELLGIEDKKIDEFKDVINEYHDITDKRLKEILLNALKYLKNKKYISTSKQLIIVKDKKYIPIYEVKEIGLSVIEAQEMIEKAKEFALKQLQSKYKGIELITMSNIMGSYRDNEFKNIYDDYVRKNYDWDYTFEQIVITRNENLKDLSIEYSEYVESKKALNKLLINAVKQTMVTKYNNLLVRYDEETKRRENIMDNDALINEYLELGIINEDEIFKKEPFKYPESFINYIDTYIDNELRI